MTEEIKREENVLLKGTPELKIIHLVRRSHNAQECKHKGNCLSESEMIIELNVLLKSLLLQKEKEWREEMVQKIEEDSQGKAAILAMNGHINVHILFEKKDIIHLLKTTNE